MTRERFNRVLAWSPADEDSARAGCHHNHFRKRPAVWEVCMAAQRFAWHYGPAEAYLRLYGPRQVAA